MGIVWFNVPLDTFYVISETGSRGWPRIKDWAAHIHEDASRPTSPSVSWSQKVGKDHEAAQRFSHIM